MFLSQCSTILAVYIHVDVFCGFWKGCIAKYDHPRCRKRQSHENNMNPQKNEFSLVVALGTAIGFVLYSTVAPFLMSMSQQKLVPLRYVTLP